MFHPLADNKEKAEYHYLMSVQTALWPFSGTQIVPRFFLEGDQADSDVRKISSCTGPKVGHIFLALITILKYLKVLGK